MPWIATAKDLDLHRVKLRNAVDPHRTSIHLCAGSGCSACGCAEVADAFRRAFGAQQLDQTVDLKLTGCPGFCQRGPLAVIRPAGIFYQRIAPADVELIVEQTIKHGQLVPHLLYREESTAAPVARVDEIPFYRRQKRLILERNGLIDPTSIDDYLLLGGYGAAAKALTSMSPERIVAEIKRSGLRGRGGAGFPTGVKWETCKNAKGEPKYVICNADQGDPGAFTDRALLEGNPHAVIEGMIIGAYAIRSEAGYVYVRNQYPRAVETLSTALDQARESGFLGRDILGSGFDFDIELHRGGGAFVCGESTALLASLEGKIGEPRAKYVHTVEYGLWERPSTLNNVETWANVPLIIERGADWYASIGTESSKGTKVFALSGKIRNTGLVEVPMGTTLREILFDIGDGAAGSKKLKAVQIGGPAGGTLIVETESREGRPALAPAFESASGEPAGGHLDQPLEFDGNSETGSMIGSGGLIVMDEDSCMVDLAKYLVSFLAEESCGKCLPCREGLPRLQEILKRISEGEGCREDIARLQEISETVGDLSLCQLGGRAPHPVLSTLRSFRDEYVSHILDRRCPAGVCQALTSYVITEACGGDAACAEVCPTEAISGGPGSLQVIDPGRCIKCDACYQVCQLGAVARVKRGESDATATHARLHWKRTTHRRCTGATA